MNRQPRSKFDQAVLSLLVVAWFSLQAWTLKEVVGLKVQVAQLDTKLTGHIEQIASK